MCTVHILCIFQRGVDERIEVAVLTSPSIFKKCEMSLSEICHDGEY